MEVFTQLAHVPSPAPASPAIDPRLLKVMVILLRGGSWRYLRYLHFRNYLAKVAPDVTSICICGAGGGFAEIAAAIEFPHIHFTLTDMAGNGYPNYYRAMDYAWRTGIDNMSFSVWNVLVPTKRRFDMVASTEMLEHIEDDAAAVRNMRAAASKYVYCLVPFAEKSLNADPVIRKRAWEKCEHYVCGYDPARLETLFGAAIRIAGTYWSDCGLPFRQKIQRLSFADIDRDARQLLEEAAKDDRELIPETIKDAAGIKILAHA